MLNHLLQFTSVYSKHENSNNTSSRLRLMLVQVPGARPLCTTRLGRLRYGLILGDMGPSWVITCFHVMALVSIVYWHYGQDSWGMAFQRKKTIPPYKTEQGLSCSKSKPNFLVSLEQWNVWSITNSLAASHMAITQLKTGHEQNKNITWGNGFKEQQQSKLLYDGKNYNRQIKQAYGFKEQQAKFVWWPIYNPTRAQIQYLPNLPRNDQKQPSWTV